MITGSMVGYSVFNILFSLMVASFAAWRLPGAAGASTVIRKIVYITLKIKFYFRLRPDIYISIDKG